jgi:hypothetical protein
MHNIKKITVNSFAWYKDNIASVVFIIFLHIAISYVVNLPYINIFTSLFSFLPWLIDWIAVVILFRPASTIILKAGLLLFVVNILFALLKIGQIVELIGNISYLMIATYILISLKEIKK